MTYLDLNPCYLRLLRVGSYYTLSLPTTPHSHLHMHTLQVISNPPVPTPSVLMTVQTTHTEPTAPHTQHTQHTSQAHFLKFPHEKKQFQFWNLWYKVWISANGFCLPLRTLPRSQEAVLAARYSCILEHNDYRNEEKKDICNVTLRLFIRTQ